MRTGDDSLTPKQILEDVKAPKYVRDIWTGNYDKVFPISIQNFDLTSVLPAVFYMFRYGHRPANGAFADTFSDSTVKTRSGNKRVTVDNVAKKLSETEGFDGFNDPLGRAILGDLLLSFCLENTNCKEGRTESVQRVAPTHYLASWIDLPENVGHLRFVPEMIVAILADQKGEWVELSKVEDRTRFPVGVKFNQNALIQAFYQGMSIQGNIAEHSSDLFNEATIVGMDQLLMIRIAQQIGRAPNKLRGEGERISNQRPISEKAVRRFTDDIRRFTRSYSASIPRHAFVDLVESGIAIGMTSIFTSMAEILFDWAETGRIKEKSYQMPTPLFADCSSGMNRTLRALSEQSMDDFMRRIERLPVIFMALRLIDYEVIYDRTLKNKMPAYRPYATEYLDCLGEILKTLAQEKNGIAYELNQLCQRLAEAFDENYPEAAENLRNYESQPNPVWRLAEVFTDFLGRSFVHHKLLDCINSILLADSPNGIAIRRRVQRKNSSGVKATGREARSVILTDPVLDYLVHLLLLPSGGKTGCRALSFDDFLREIREEYGLWVDASPPNMEISSDHLHDNRRILERRLRDLGLLMGVNDAESMKLLRPRFEINGGNNGVD